MLLIIGIVCLLLIVAALVYGKIRIDKKHLLTSAYVEFSDDNGSVVRVSGDEYSFYKVERQFLPGVKIKVFDMKLIESLDSKENWYLLFHREHFKRLLRKKYYLKEAVFCYNDRGKKAIVQRKTVRNNWFAVDTKTNEPILLHYVPQDVAAEKNPLVDYECLVLTPPISATEADC